jgi:hypothetical protein
MRHVSAETMAGFRQGDLSPRRRSRISSHLAGCDRCRRLDEDLAGVRTLLAGAQSPPIPEHLAARIQTALATEAASRVVRPAESENGIGTAAPGTARGLPAGGQRWLPRLPGLPRSRVALGSLAAAAAVLVVIGGMYEMFASRGTGSGASGTAAAPAHRPASQSAGNGIALPAAGGRSVSGPALRYQHSGHQDSVTPVTTDTDFTPGRLGTQVAAAVARYGAGVASSPLSGARSPAATAPAAQAPRATTFGAIPVSLLQGCVNRIDAGELVLLVDVARYRGAPATVIVTSMTVIGPEQVWVVGTGCSGSRSDVLTHATMAAP